MKCTHMIYSTFYVYYVIISIIDSWVASIQSFLSCDKCVICSRHQLIQCGISLSISLYYTYNRQSKARIQQEWHEGETRRRPGHLYKLLQCCVDKCIDPYDHDDDVASIHDHDDAVGQCMMMILYGGALVRDCDDDVVIDIFIFSNYSFSFSQGKPNPSGFPAVYTRRGL